MGGRHAHLNKNKRVTRKRLRTNKYSVDSTNGLTRRESPKRAPYFKHYRDERRALSILENTFPTDFSRKTYRAIRYLYYLVIPHLARYLWFPPDRARLQNVEIDFFNCLLSWKFRNGRTEEPGRVPVWSFRSQMTAECGHRQKL